MTEDIAAAIFRPSSESYACPSDMSSAPRLVKPNPKVL